MACPKSYDTAKTSERKHIWRRRPDCSHESRQPLNAYTMSTMVMSSYFDCASFPARGKTGSTLVQLVQCMTIKLVYLILETRKAGMGITLESLTIVITKPTIACDSDNKQH